MTKFVYFLQLAPRRYTNEQDEFLRRHPIYFLIIKFIRKPFLVIIPGCNPVIVKYRQKRAEKLQSMLFRLISLSKLIYCVKILKNPSITARIVVTLSDKIETSGTFYSHYKHVKYFLFLRGKC